MVGNERVENCTKCKQTFGNEQTYMCDLCAAKIHKNCACLSPSEVRCMPLQKRVLALLCIKCKEYLSRTPEMTNIMNEMKNELIKLKHEVNELRKEINENKTQQIATYCDIAKKEKKTENKPSQVPMLIMKSKTGLDSGKTLQLIQEKINPNELQIGVKNVNSTKNGNVIVKCATKEEITILRKAVESKLGNTIDANIPKLKKPRVKIVGYIGEETQENIEDQIRQQNKWIQQEDKFSVTYIKKPEQKKYSTIFVECSPETYWKLKDSGVVCIGWNRCAVYEDIPFTRCFRCQGYNHKSSACTNETICGTCAGQHETKTCKSNYSKCFNCNSANEKYHLKNNVEHTAMDTNCPSTKYFLEKIKKRIDYGE